MTQKNKCTYQSPSGRRFSQVGVSAFVAGAVAAGVVFAPGVASADPSQQGGFSPQETPPSQQGGFNPAPNQDSPQQGGFTPAPPAPAPVTPPSYTPGPLGLPPAPSAPPSDHVAPYEPSYQGDYNPVPVAPIHIPDPTAPKVKRVAPAKPKTLLIGNFEQKYDDIPNFPNKANTLDWANGWASYGSQEIANFLISIGIPEDVAIRQAAATITGAAAGGAIGGAVGFTSTTIFVGLLAIPIGGVIGGAIGSTMGNPVSIAGGAALGVAGGAAVAVGAGTVVGIGSAIIGGLIGGGLGYMLGAGDPGGKAQRPGDTLPQQEKPGKHRKAAPLPNPEDNQFQVVLAKDDAGRVGLPPVDYVVNNRGDVSVNVGGTKVGWTAEQAQAPLKALGPAAPAVEKAINDVTREVGNQAQKAIEGLQVTWPQLQGPATQQKKAPAAQQKTPVAAGKRGR